MVTIRGWYFEGGKVRGHGEDDNTPKESTMPKYVMMDTFLSDGFKLSYREFDIDYLFITGEIKLIGKFFNSEEVFKVVDSQRPFDFFFVSKVVLEKLTILLNKRNNVIIS